MVKAKWVFIACISTILLFSLASEGRATFAADDEEIPERKTTIVASFTAQEWWLIRWADNKIVCQILSEHDGLPVREEVLAACGRDVFNEWIQTPPCETAAVGSLASTLCTGLYLFNVGVRTGERLVEVAVPLPVVWLDLARCILIPPENLCSQIPSLLLTGEEPLPNERITAIHAIFDDRTYTCHDQVCEVPLRPTLFRGAEVEFWAESSFGDTSERFTAIVRVVDSGVRPAPGGGGWHVDVLSTQWRGGPTDSCSLMWKAFPPIGGAPGWLLTPREERFLSSEEPYQYLAGRLIAHGFVDVDDCPRGGLLENGYANACGLERARGLVNMWQNQFDPRILAVAEETGLPANLMKNLFAQESQFWPGMFRIENEYGLGQLTDMGADTILLWNRSFYDQFCPQILDKNVCSRGYVRLSNDEKSLLRGALATYANADCPDCPGRVDLNHADFSVMIFAQSLLANCGQVSRTVFNATNSSPGMVSEYEDLWRFTLANYHAGPGCLAFAIHTTWDLRQRLNWENVSTHFTEPCQSVIPYVNLIAR